MKQASLRIVIHPPSQVTTTPGAPDNTNAARIKPGTPKGQVTYEGIGEVPSNQDTCYDGVYPTPESIYQEIDDEAHYQPLKVAIQQNRSLQSRGTQHRNSPKCSKTLF